MLFVVAKGVQPLNRQINKISITRVGPTKERFAHEAGRGILTLDSILEFVAQPRRPGGGEFTLDLSKVGWVGLFEWSCLMALLHGKLAENPDLKISIDFVGNRQYGLIPYDECKAFIDNNLLVPKYPRADYIDSYVVHCLVSFVKAVEEAGSFENVAGGRLVLRWLSADEARRPGWFRRDSKIEESVIFPRTNVSAAEMSVRFTTRSQVEAWRQGMREKHIPEAAIFASDEFWRILCHELARNVSEHADGPGFLTARVVMPSNGTLPYWCNDVLSSAKVKQSQAFSDSGFLELCVCDAGRGIPETVSKAFDNRFRERWTESELPNPVPHLQLLKFAFDELGTRKDREHSWLTDRHALGHILFIVGKYGGSLTLRSGEGEVIYAPQDGVYRRCKTQLGYEPEAEKKLNLALPGTHIQIIVPLTARPRMQGDRSSRVLTEHLPEAYHVDVKHPVGPLVPVREKLDVLGSCVSGDEVKKFQESCRALAKSLLIGEHPRHEILVFDFAEVDWPPARFETFLYLFQNVLVGRPVLFTNVNQSFAELVCGFEENAEAPSFLPEEMRNEIHERAKDREFTDGRFLETYSGIGAVVLGLGPDKGEYLFGLRNGRLRAALLEIVAGEEQTTKGLAEAHRLEPGTVGAVLSAARTLFRCRQDERWELAWSRLELANDGINLVNTIEVQRLRSIISHFDLVANNCDAFRQTAHPPGSSKSLPARFYLPSEDTVYSGFFESSRILARDRYVTEVAERLIHRIWYGLTHRCQPPRTLSEIRVLACSTTPSVMLAQAVRKAWPVAQEGERPVVIDYGPALFSGADPARMPSSPKPPGAVVIHDVFDEGRLSRRLVDMTQAQGIEVLLEACFVRFLKEDECSAGVPVAYSATSCWKTLKVPNRIDIPVHAMVGIASPKKERRRAVTDWGSSDEYVDHVVDPRSLRPVPLRSLRLESDVSVERSLTRRDPYLKELDTNDAQCQLAAGHFVYGQRHFGVVADIRGILTGLIGRQIIAWLADVCCDEKDRQIPVWETREGDRPMPKGAVSAILMPLHSQIHYLLPGLQIELAQRGKRVPHFFLDATSFGGGVEIYDTPYQLLTQIDEAAKAIKKLMDASPSLDSKSPEIVKNQLRLLIIDDAIFSGRTIQTLVDSIGKRHLPYIRQRVYRGDSRYADPIQWIRVFAVLNELPAAKSAMWYQLTRCSVCETFRFDAYAPFIGVATYTADDCPACRELEHLEHVQRRAEAAGATAAVAWLKTRREALLPLSTEAPSFGSRPRLTLLEPIDVLAPQGNTASERYKPVHADTAIWRFLELMYLSYPLSDVLGCLKTARDAGVRHSESRGEYARFRLGVYDWCLHNWHQVHLYRAEETILAELKAEVETGESCFAEIIYRMRSVLMEDLRLGILDGPQAPVMQFVKWAVEHLAKNDSIPQKNVSETTLLLDVVLTILYLDIGQQSLRNNGLLEHLKQVRDQSPKPLSFVSLLHLRLTRPEHVADPLWGLTTIAQTFYRGHHGITPEDRRRSDHQLLGRLAEDFLSNPQDNELRQRLGGCLHAFLAAVDNLRPYFGNDFLPSVADPAKKLQDCLMNQDKIELAELSAHNLVQSMRAPESFADFEKNCHISTKQLISQLELRLDHLKTQTSGAGDEQHGNPYAAVKMTHFVDSQVGDWFLMTHIPDLLAFLSNIVFEPAKEFSPLVASDVKIAKDTSERPNMLTIETLTCFGRSAEAIGRLNAQSGKIARDRDRLKLFGVVFEDAVKSEAQASDCVLLRLHVPVGFKRNGG